MTHVKLDIPVSNLSKESFLLSVSLHMLYYLLVYASIGELICHSPHHGKTSVNNSFKSFNPCQTVTQTLT